MNSHKHARTTYATRVEMVRQLQSGALGPSQAARMYGITVRTVRKWWQRFLAGGLSNLADASSAPKRSPRALPEGKAHAIVELRQQRWLQSRIARELEVSEATVSRVLRRAGISKLKDLEPKQPPVRYERAQPGELLHIDIKKLGRFERTGHRISGERRQRSRAMGWEYLFVAVDDHARIAFSALHEAENKDCACRFLWDAVAYYASLGVKVQRLLTDNGRVFASKDFLRMCEEFGIAKRFTRPYRPQTNGKAERFIQSALREWAYGWSYANSAQRADELAYWQHHYNWHRPHHGIGGQVPMQRLPANGYNVLTHDT
jgi:transposase InsO family protein